MTSILEELVEFVALGGELTPGICGCSLSTASLIMNSDAFKAAVVKRKEELARGD